MNLFFSCFSAALVLLLELLYPLDKLVQKQKNQNGSVLVVVYKILHKVHIVIGILVIPVVLCHCSTVDQQSMFGAVLLVLLILLALTYFLQKPLGKHWKPLHQWLAIMLMGITIYHGFIEFL